MIEVPSQTPAHFMTSICCIVDQQDGEHGMNRRFTGGSVKQPAADACDTIATLIMLTFTVACLYICVAVMLLDWLPS